MPNTLSASLPALREIVGLGSQADAGMELAAQKAGFVHEEREEFSRAQWLHQSEQILIKRAFSGHVVTPYD